MTALLVLAGGAVGAPLRYLTDLMVQARYDTLFPWGTFTVNVVGSLVLGGVAASVQIAGAASWVQPLVGTGFCGALTTFSTFGFETYRLVEDGSWLEAGLNVVASVAAGAVAFLLGWWLVTALS
jgi:CrcB protein